MKDKEKIFIMVPNRSECFENFYYDCEKMIPIYQMDLLYMFNFSGFHASIKITNSFCGGSGIDIFCL